MKRYSVIFDPQARLEALEAADYVAQDDPERAAKWFSGLKKGISSLARMPTRCALALESKFSDIEIRHYIHGSHRVLFRIEEDARIVRILHVRHASRRTIGEPDGHAPDE